MKIEKKKTKEEVIEGEEVKTAWDIKKIVAAIFILALLFVIGSYFFMPKQSGARDDLNRGTLGISSENDKEDVPPLPSTQDVEKIITNVQESLSNITSDNIVSSQTEIQNMITELEKLRNEKEATEVFCDLVCRNN